MAFSTSFPVLVYAYGQVCVIINPSIPAVIAKVPETGFHHFPPPLVKAAIAVSLPAHSVH
jgi:hypothetical protein